MSCRKSQLHHFVLACNCCPSRIKLGSFWFISAKIAASDSRVWTCFEARLFLLRGIRSSWQWSPGVKKTGRGDCCFVTFGKPTAQTIYLYLHHLPCPKHEPRSVKTDVPFLFEIFDFHRWSMVRQLASDILGSAVPVILPETNGRTSKGFEPSVGVGT